MNPQIRRLALDLGPLLIFFAAFKCLRHLRRHRRLHGGDAGGAGDRLLASRRKLSPMPLFTAVLVLIFGGLTLYLKNDIFIKMKPTVLYAFFGVILLGGLLFNRLFIKYVFAQAFELDEAGWRKLTCALGHFLSGPGGAQRSGVAQHLAPRPGFTFKVWGIIPLIFLFALAQTPLLMKHQAPMPTTAKTRND